MDFSSLFSDPGIQRLFISVALGALIGLERELSGKDPSLRTFSLISVGSCLFSLTSELVTLGTTHADPGRIAAQIVPGIGFIGAGTIFRSTRGISGLTTAALMWVTAAIGMTVGFGHIRLAVSATFMALLITFGLKFVHRIIRYFRPGYYSKDTW